MSKGLLFILHRGGQHCLGDLFASVLKDMHACEILTNVK